MNPSCEANMDNKRKEVSTEQVLGSNQHLDSSHLALIPSQMNLNCKELEASQAKTISLEVCIDGWNITYKEFQPRKTKQSRKQLSQTKMNLQSQKADKTPNNNSIEYDITKDLAKRRCHHCQQKEHYVKSCPQKNRQVHHESS